MSVGLVDALFWLSFIRLFFVIYLVYTARYRFSFIGYSLIYNWQPAVAAAGEYTAPVVSTLLSHA